MSNCDYCDLRVKPDSEGRESPHKHGCPGLEIEMLRDEIEQWQKAGRDAVLMSQPDRSTSSNVRWVPKWVLHNISKLLPDSVPTKESDKL